MARLVTQYLHTDRTSSFDRRDDITLSSPRVFSVCIHGVRGPSTVKKIQKKEKKKREKSIEYLSSKLQIFFILLTKHV